MRHTQPHGRKTLVLLAAAAFALSLIALVPSGAAHMSANHGTIKVHDNMTADPPTKNEPHVSCDDFYVEGFNMSDGAGHLMFYGWPPTGNMTLVHHENWTVTSDADSDDDSDDDDQDDGFGFLAGPFSLEPGHYRVEAFVDMGHPGNTEHFAKSKMFWVEPCDEVEVLPCPTDLSLQARGDQTILVTWTPAAGSNGTNVYRSTGGTFQYVTTVDAGVGEWVDEDVTQQETYTYMLTSLFGDRESVDCEQASATAIPTFPTAVGAVAAIAGGSLAYAWISRRKR